MDLLYASVVVLGDMNPAIVQPAWLRRLRIVDEEEIDEAEKSKDLIVLPGLSQIPCKSFLLQVERIRFSMVSKDLAKMTLLPEVAARIFTFLNHTPIRAFGVNFHAKVQLSGGQKASDYMRAKFAAESSLLDRALKKDWEIESRVTTKTSNPRIQVSILRMDNEEDALKVGANFHYDHSDTGDLPALLGKRFQEDREYLEQIARELIR